MRVFFDLDGTIINIFERWYHLHIAAAAHAGIPAMGRREYIESKRKGVPERHIVSLSEETPRFAAYESFRFSNIESSEFLQYDELYTESCELLERVRAYRPTAITLRHRADTLQQELIRLGIHASFDAVHIAGDIGKGQMISSLYDAANIRDMPFITDGVDDYRTAVHLKMRPFVVGYGTRNATYLRARGVPVVYETAGDLIQALDSVI